MMYEQARSFVQQVQQFIAEVETKEEPKTDPLRDYVYIDWAAVQRVPQNGDLPQEMSRSYMHEIPDENDEGTRSRTTSASDQHQEDAKVDKNNNAPAKKIVVENYRWDSDEEDEFEVIHEHNQIINAWQFDPAFSKYD